MPARPNGTPAPVATNDLIDTAWGNAVVNTFDVVPFAAEGDIAGGEGLSVGTNANYLVFNVTAPWAGIYLVMVNAYFTMTVGGSSDVVMFAGVDGVGANARGAGARLTNASDGTTLSDFGLMTLAAGAHAVQVIGRCTVGGVVISGRTATVIGLRKS